MIHSIAKLCEQRFSSCIPFAVNMISRKGRSLEILGRSFCPFRTLTLTNRISLHVTRLKTSIKTSKRNKKKRKYLTPSFCVYGQQMVSSICCIYQRGFFKFLNDFSFFLYFSILICFRHSLTQYWLSLNVIFYTSCSLTYVHSYVFCDFHSFKYTLTYLFNLNSKESDAQRQVQSCTAERTHSEY